MDHSLLFDLALQLSFFICASVVEGDDRAISNLSYSIWRVFLCEKKLFFLRFYGEADLLLAGFTNANFRTVTSSFFLHLIIRRININAALIDVTCKFN